MVYQYSLLKNTHAFDYMFTRLICLVLFVKKSIYLHLNFCVVRADGIFSDKFSSKLPPSCHITITFSVFILRLGIADRTRYTIFVIH